MKKIALGFSLALATFGLFLSPGMAQMNPSQAMPVLSVADQAFLTSLATPAPTPAAKRPAVGQKALCTASATCWNGTVLSCEGNNSTTSCTGSDSNCAAGQSGYVSCDGSFISCPSCPCSLNCAQERTLCQQYCYPCPISFSCSVTSCTVSCNCRFQGCPV